MKAPIPMSVLTALPRPFEPFGTDFLRAFQSLIAVERPCNSSGMTKLINRACEAAPAVISISCPCTHMIKVLSCYLDGRGGYDLLSIRGDLAREMNWRP